MCSGSEAGSYFRLIDFVYHSTLSLREIKKKSFGRTAGHGEDAADPLRTAHPPPCVSGLGFGVWGVGCGVWGVGFGV